jgi:hypothetical protein
MPDKGPLYLNASARGRLALRQTHPISDAALRQQHWRVTVTVSAGPVQQLLKGDHSTL